MKKENEEESEALYFFPNFYFYQQEEMKQWRKHAYIMRDNSFQKIIR